MKLETVLCLIVGYLSFFRPVSTSDDLASDISRPQWHFLPPSNWMNDPCGPILLHDVYHIFYQYNPYNPIWGNMSWGHAYSKDMVHWKHDPVALWPSTWYDKEGVFSGSAVVDSNGFDVESQQVYIFYTGVYTPVDPTHITLKDGKHPWREIQAAAVTRPWDGLRDWTKITSNNTLLSSPPFPFEEIAGFRDPAVKFDATNREWKMLVGSGKLSEGGNIVVYTSGSSDLQQATWTLAGVLIQGNATEAYAPGTDPVSSDFMWECPDIIDLGGVHMLVYGTASSVYYSLGHMNWGKGSGNDGGSPSFQPRLSIGANEEPNRRRAKLDHGLYYAARFQSYDDNKGSLTSTPAVVWGWLQEPPSRSDEELMRSGWAGAMSMPRTLHLTEVPDEGSCGLYRGTTLLHVAPLPSMQQLRVPVAASRTSDLPVLHNLSAEIRLDLLAPSAEGPEGSFEVELSLYPIETDNSVRGDMLPFIAVHYSYVFLDQEQRFAAELRVGDYSCHVPVIPADCSVEHTDSGSHPSLHIFLDGSVIEVFGGYDCVITTRSYSYDHKPAAASAPLQPELSCRGDRVGSCHDVVKDIISWQMMAISDDRLTT